MGRIRLAIPGQRRGRGGRRLVQGEYLPAERSKISHLDSISA
jgi:hypothetical protein